MRLRGQIARPIAQLTALDFLPNFTGLRDSSIFFHEIIGMVWYRLRLLAQA